MEPTLYQTSDHREETMRTAEAHGVTQSEQTVLQQTAELPDVLVVRGRLSILGDVNNDRYTGRKRKL